MKKKKPVANNASNTHTSHSVGAAWMRGRLDCEKTPS